MAQPIGTYLDDFGYPQPIFPPGSAAYCHPVPQIQQPRCTRRFDVPRPKRGRTYHPATSRNGPGTKFPNNTWNWTKDFEDNTEVRQASRNIRSPSAEEVPTWTDDRNISGATGRKVVKPIGHVDGCRCESCQKFLRIQQTETIMRRRHEVTSIEFLGDSDQCNWKLGGHGMGCSCYSCNVTFPPVGWRRADDPKLIQRLVQNLVAVPRDPQPGKHKGKDHDPNPFRYDPRNYHAAGRIGSTDYKNYSSTVEHWATVLTKWGGDKGIMRLRKPGYSQHVPQVHTLIFDDSGIFGGSLVAEYYLDLSLMKYFDGSFGKSRRIPRETVEEKDPYKMMGTMVADVSDFNISSDNWAHHKQRTDMEEVIRLLVQYRLVQGHGAPLRVIYIVGNVSVIFTRNSPDQMQEVVRKTVQWMMDIVIRNGPQRPNAMRITWLGMGIGIPKGESDNRKRYREMTRQIANCHVGGPHRFFNIFTEKSGHSETGIFSKTERNRIRKDLIKFIETGDAQDLPEWVYPTATPEISLIQVLADVTGSPVEGNEEAVSTKQPRHPTDDNQMEEARHANSLVCYCCGVMGHRFKHCPQKASIIGDPKSDTYVACVSAHCEVDTDSESE